MSDTQRTDAATEAWLPNEGVSPAFARQLERELNEAKAELARVTAERDDAVKDLLELTGLAEEVRHLAKVEMGAGA